jgi:hypothetical protein
VKVRWRCLTRCSLALRISHNRPVMRTAGSSLIRRAWFWVLLGVVLSVAACNSFDEPYTVPVFNDLQRPVALSVCTSSDCSKTTDRWLLQPEESGAVGVEPDTGYNRAIIRDSHDHVIGCLPFRFSGRPSGNVRVKASQALPCGSSGGARAAHNKDWPEPSL